MSAPAPGRTVLPTRRDNRTERITFTDPDTGAETKFYVCVGFMPGPFVQGGGRAIEVFLRSSNCFSMLDRMLDDQAVMISIMLQHGYRPASIRRHLGRHEETARTLVVAALDTVEDMERQYLAEKVREGERWPQREETYIDGEPEEQR